MRLPFCGILFCAALLSASARASTDCSALGTMKFPGATVDHSEAIAAGTPGLPGFGATAKVPAFCRVRGVLRPSADSVIHFEVWLPQTGWNGRLLNVGNGGFAGSIEYRQMAGNLRRGYATAGSDAGHQADAEDASWAYGHPEKVADFGYRAVHLTAGLSKAIVKAFFDTPLKSAYFDSCSDGGREALMEAQRFPEDYNGILAGAPANNWAHMVTGGVGLLQTLARDPASYVRADKLPAIMEAALNACDALDGLKDGIVSNPERCHFDPAVLACHGEEDASCLTPPQVKALRGIYTGYLEPDGKALFPGLVPGDEYPGWASWVLGSAPAGSSGANYTSGYFRYMVLQDPTWNPLTADVSRLIPLAVERTSKNLDSTNPDLSAFAAHGGKLILYHGWNDPAISPWNTVNYFKAVQKAMGKEKAGSTLRLYMAPGMEHCLGGPGPNVFGQLSLDGAVGEGSGAMDLLQTWVEDGKAPGPILAANRIENRAPAGSVSATTPAMPQRIVRPLCPYPQAAQYDGHGDPHAATSFSCREP